MIMANVIGIIQCFLLFRTCFALTWDQLYLSTSHIRYCSAFAVTYKIKALKALRSGLSFQTQRETVEINKNGCWKQHLGFANRRHLYSCSTGPLAAMFVMNQHQSNNTKKTYTSSWLNGKIAINCQNVNVIYYRLLFVTMLNFPANIQ